MLVAFNQSAAGSEIRFLICMRQRAVEPYMCTKMQLLQRLDVNWYTYNYHHEQIKAHVF